MILCEEAGKARMDMISYTSENEKLVSHNIWKELDMELGKPYKLVYNYNRTYTSRLAYCEAGTFNLDPETLQPSEENNMLWQFSENPDKVEIVGGATMMNSDPKREIIVTSEGELYWRKYDDLMHGIQFTFPVNRLEKAPNTLKFPGTSDTDPIMTGIPQPVLLSSMMKQIAVFWLWKVKGSKTLGEIPNTKPKIILTNCLSPEGQPIMKPLPGKTWYTWKETGKDMYLPF